MATDSIHPDVPRRKALKVAVGALSNEVGFSHAEDAALETLTEMLQSYVTELGRSSRAFAELSGRTEPMLSDVVMSLVEMGLDVQTLPAYAKRPNKMVFMPPGPAPPSQTPRTLQAGQKKSHPSHIPDHYPAFPDPHTYIRTATHKKPVTEYQLIREKAASQKRDVERALTRFIAKTGDTENLFPDDPYAYPLIACHPKEIPYLDALLPKDFDLDGEDPYTEQSQQQMNAPPSDREDMNKSMDSAKGSASGAANTSMQEGQQGVGTEPGTPGKQQMGSTDTTDNADDSQIDNPYLRPIKMPKLKGGKSKSKY